MRRFERFDGGVPDRTGTNPFTKEPIVIKGRPARTVRCDVDVHGTEVTTSWTWFEGGAPTAGPHANGRLFTDPTEAEAYGAELGEDLLADGFTEETPGASLPSATYVRANPGSVQVDPAGDDLVAAIVARCRERGWFGSDMDRRFQRGESVEQRQFQHAPATSAQIRETERQLGFPLPPLLRGLYTGVANGGFGPGYGFVGVVGGASADFADDLADAYRLERSHSPRLEESEVARDEDGWFEPFYDEWPGRVIRLVHWGCAIWSCLDVRRDYVLRFEPLHGKRARDAMMVEAVSLRSWLERWLEGVDVFRS